MARISRSNIWIDGTQAAASYQTLRKHVNTLNQAIRELPRNSKEYNDAVKELQVANKAVDLHRKKVRGVAGAFGEAKQGLTSMLKQFAPVTLGLTAIGGAVGGVVSGVKDWVVTNVKFEKSLSSLRSLTGLGAEGMSTLRKESVRMGKETTQSANEVVDAMKNIGSQRPDLLKNADALSAVTEKAIVLGEAGEISMDKSAQAITSTMNQMDLAADQVDRIINAYAAGSQAGPATIENIADAMDKSGSVAKGYNIDLETQIGLIETLAEKNIKGSEAGTALRNVLLKMQTFNGVNQEALNSLEAMGVNMDLIMDTSVPYEERMAEMAKASGDAALMAKIFGTENVVAAKAILENTDTVKKYTEAVTDTNKAYEQQAINNDNMEGDLKSLSSAWEGLTLTLGGGEIFRPVIQSGTDFINWISDSITAVSEWDATGMETQIMKLTRAMPFLSSELEFMLDQQILVNDMTKAVSESMKEEATNSAVLTRRLDENNRAIKNKTESEEELAARQKENDEIIKTLNEKYPELTENIDLNSASTKELAGLQRDINESLIDHAVAAATAAQAEQYLQDIMAKTMENALIAQQIRELRNGSLMEKMQAGELLQQWTENNEQLKNAQKGLENIGNVSKQVTNSLKKSGIDFGAAYQTNSEIAQTAVNDLARMEKMLNGDISSTQKAILEEKIKAQKQLIKASKEGNDQMVKDALSSLGTLEEEAEKQRVAEEEAQKVKEANAKKAADLYKKAKDDLIALIETTKKFKEENDYEQQLNAFKEGQEKEIFELEHALEEKYKKEIETAEELAKRKGEIGLKAAEQLQVLETMKAEELARKKLEIEERYRKEAQEKAADDAIAANLQWLKDQEGIEQAKVDLELARTALAISEEKKLRGTASKEALEEYNNALLEQEKLRKQRELESLMDLDAEKEMSHEEFLLRKEQLEAESAERINQIHTQNNEQIQQLALDRFNESMQNGLEAVEFFNNAISEMYEMRLGYIQDQENKEISALNNAAKQGLLTEEELQSGIREIEDKYDAERDQIKSEQAQKDKAVALMNAVINTAAAVAKALPNIPLSIAAGVMGGLQIAKIASTPVPQYFEGGFTTVTGAQDGKTYNAKNIGRPKTGWNMGGPSLALINEKEPEYFIPSGMMRNQTVANHVQAIEAIRVNQFANGGFTNGGSGTGMSDDRLLQMLQMNVSMLRALSHQIPNMGVRLDDGKLDDMNDRMVELNEIRS